MDGPDNTAQDVLVKPLLKTQKTTHSWQTDNTTYTAETWSSAAFVTNNFHWRWL